MCISAMERRIAFSVVLVGASDRLKIKGVYRDDRKH